MSGLFLSGHDPQSPPSDLQPARSPSSDLESRDGSECRKRTSSGQSTEKRSANKVCRVCGDKAFSYNFNVITCESCKAFFRRNANKEKEIRCPFNEKCEINVVSRRFCQRCRLYKCFQVGMKKEWIMTDEARLEKKQRVEENRERRKEEAKRRVDYEGKGDCLIQPPSVGPSSIPSDLPSVSSFNSPSTLLNAFTDVSCKSSSIVHAFSPLSSSSSTSLPPPPSLPSLPSSHHHSSHHPHHHPRPSSFVLSSPSPHPHPPTTSQIVLALEQQIQQQQQIAAVVQQITNQSLAPSSLQTPTPAPPPLINPPSVPEPSPLNILGASPLSMGILMSGALEAAATCPSSSSTVSLGPAHMTITPVPPQMAPPPSLPPLAPPPSAVAAVARASPVGTPLVLPPSVGGGGMGAGCASTSTARQDRCGCKCACGRYSPSRSIVDQAQEEFEAEERERWRAAAIGAGAIKAEDLHLAEFIGSGSSSVSWLNSANPNSIQMTPPDRVAFIRTEDPYVDLRDLKESFLRNPIPGPAAEPVVVRAQYDGDFGPMEHDDEYKLKELHEANKQVWSGPLEQEDAKLHEEGCPTKVAMLQMMVGAVKRMINMVKKLPIMKELHGTDQIKLIRSCYLDFLIIRGAMAYDPNENAWKGPTPKSGYSIKLDVMNDDTTQENMYKQSIRLYAMFKEEYRQNESIMLLLGQICLFDPTVEGLNAIDIVKDEQNKYKKCLKRLMWTILDRQHTRAQLEYRTLLDRLATVRQMNKGARGIMEENEDQMDPLLKELLQENKEGTP